MKKCKKYLDIHNLDITMDDMKIMMRLSCAIAMSNILYSQFYDIQQDLRSTRMFTLNNNNVNTKDIHKIPKIVDSFLDRLQHIFRRLGYEKVSNENDIENMLTLSDEVLAPYINILWDRLMTCINNGDSNTLLKLYNYLQRLPSDKYIETPKDICNMLFIDDENEKNK